MDISRPLAAAMGMPARLLAACRNTNDLTGPSSRKKAATPAVSIGFD
jgi:hypothetical protein